MALHPSHLPASNNNVSPTGGAATDDPPPARFGSWRNVYLCVAAYLVVLIVLFYTFRMVFER